MAIQAIYYDEQGRVVRRTEEADGEGCQIPVHDDGGAEQVTPTQSFFARKGTQRRPAATAFSRHLLEEF